MTKVEAIKKVLEDNGGIATWNIIYNQIEKYYSGIKSSNEWEAGIRGVLYREIKNNKNFKKVGIALFALIDYKEERIEDLRQDKFRMHSFIEGVCIEIGNFLKLKTYTADPTAKYNNLSLSEIATLPHIPDFTYKDITDTIKRIDVLWFNDKGYRFPKNAIEIVDSIGTLEPSLKRIFQLVEFNLSFYILCSKENIKKVKKELSAEPYKRISNRFVVRDYDYILNIYRNPIANTNDDFLQFEYHF
ncbi:MAG: hypothetical protein JXA68_04535 [Ignavibacteriales bacterium]|nr:hypothetical protein [Ignavibacteriales bacterium]